MFHNRPTERKEGAGMVRETKREYLEKIRSRYFRSGSGIREDSGRVLCRLWLQPEVCHRIAVEPPRRLVSQAAMTLWAELDRCPPLPGRRAICASGFSEPFRRLPH